MHRKSVSDELPADPAIDRRDYFRIEDRIGLEVCPATSVNRDNTASVDEHLHALRGELRRLDQDIRMNLATLSEKDRLMSSLIKSLNGKLDTLARIITFEQNPMQPAQWQDVILSEGGVAFAEPEDHSISPGEAVSLTMVLPPELYQIDAEAQVLELSRRPDGRNQVHTEFTDLADADRQLIARHVMRWQIRKRQQDAEQGLDT